MKTASASDNTLCGNLVFSQESEELFIENDVEWILFVYCGDKVSQQTIIFQVNEMKNSSWDTDNRTMPL